MTPQGRPVAASESGMILINVLLFVAIASGILLLMISAEDGALDRSLKMREAARAQAIARGGEISAIVALRRDAIVAPDSDHRGEPWAALAEKGAPIEGGSFDLAIADAQSRFNVNALMSEDPAALTMLIRIAQAAGLAQDDVPNAVNLVREIGPISDLRPLRLAGLSREQYARLSALLTALPYQSRINLNAVSEPMMALLLNNPAAARELIAWRERQGMLTPADFQTRQIAVPSNCGFTSDLYWVRTRVRIGATSQQLTSLLLRRRGPDQAVAVVSIGRWWGASPPDQAPPLP